MSVLPKRNKTEATQEAVAVSAEDRMALLEGFVQLVGERWGYWLARRLTAQEMSEHVKDMAKKVRELGKTISTKIEEFLETPDQEIKTVIVESRKQLADAKKEVKEAREPFQKKMNPLAKAIRYMDSVAIPDSLKELGSPIQPRFSLSDWVTSAVASKKK